jgi:hypothetical protein
MNPFPQKTIRRNKHAEPMSSGKYRKLDNFKTAIGMGANWIDQDTGIMYHIQEYYEALHNPQIPADQKPTKIHMTNYKTGEDLGWADEYYVAMKMKDPEPDPKY